MLGPAELLRDQEHSPWANNLTLKLAPRKLGKDSRRWQGVGEFVFTYNTASDTVLRVYLKQEWGRGKVGTPVRTTAEHRDRGPFQSGPRDLREPEAGRWTELHVCHRGKEGAELAPGPLASEAAG